MATDSGRSPAEAGSGHSAEPGPISVVPAETASVPNAATRDGIVAGFRAQMDLLAENERLREAVQYAADVFDDYARQQRAKGTVEGYERNLQRRDKMRAALAKARTEKVSA